MPAKHKKNRTGAVNTIVEHGKPAGVVVNESRADHLISGICEQIGLEYRYLPDDPLEIDEIVLDMAKEFLPGKRG